MGSIIGRMAHPTSERGTWNWLKNNSALGELLDVDFEGISLMSRNRASDLLIRKQEDIPANPVYPDQRFVFPAGYGTPLRSYEHLF